MKKHNDIENEKTEAKFRSVNNEAALDIDDEDEENKEKTLIESGYSIIEITARKLKKESFRARFGFQVDFEMLEDVLSSGGKVIGLGKVGLVKDGPIEVVFTIRVSKDAYKCDNLLFSDKFPQEDREKITNSVKFDIARMALTANIHEVWFLGEKLPPLVREVGGPNYSMGICFALIYGTCFQVTLKNIGITMAMAVVMGIAMSFCFRSVKYHFQGSNKIQKDIE
ncbi:MAG: hypothetical protein J6040_07815 [Clostridiales bacterium]|nr:hypothetical protein [Clostridiales bacterium]